MEKFKVIEDKENFLLNRREVKVIVEAEKNPSFQDAENLIAEKFKADKELISIKGIKGKFGRNTFLIQSFIYKNKEDKQLLEKVGKKKEKKKAGEQTQETPIQKQDTKPTTEEKK